jgi:hypothetical protein
MVEGQPDGEALVGALAATAAQAAALRGAVAQVRCLMAGAPLVTWPQPDGDGTAGHPLQLRIPTSTRQFRI